MLRLRDQFAIIGLLTACGTCGAWAADEAPQQRMYAVSCKFLEADRDNIVTTLARPQATTLEGAEAVVQVGGPSITLPAHLKERLANELPEGRYLTLAADGSAPTTTYQTARSATKWQMTVLSRTADQVQLDAKLSLTEVESVDESGTVIATQAVRVVRRVPLGKVVSVDLSRPTGQKRRIEFIVREVKRDSMQ